jgi:hypothetical protein
MLRRVVAALVDAQNDRAAPRDAAFAPYARMDVDPSSVDAERLEPGPIVAQYRTAIATGIMRADEQRVRAHAAPGAVAVRRAFRPRHGTAPASLPPECAPDVRPLSRRRRRARAGRRTRRGTGPRTRAPSGPKSDLGPLPGDASARSAPGAGTRSIPPSRSCRPGCPGGDRGTRSPSRRQSAPGRSSPCRGGLDLIVSLRDSLGATVVIVSHELPSILAIGDDCIFLDTELRTISARGNPRRLLESPPNDNVRRFLTRGRLAAVAGVAP